MSGNIGPVMWKPKPENEWSRQYHEDAAERRAVLMEEFPEFFEMCVELAEAEAHYRTIKNLKKKDPPRFYEGRDRLFQARHAVAGFASECNFTERGQRAYRRDEELFRIQYKRRQDRLKLSSARFLSRNSE